MQTNPFYVKSVDQLRIDSWFLFFGPTNSYVGSKNVKTVFLWQRLFSLSWSIKPLQAF